MVRLPAIVTSLQFSGNLVVPEEPDQRKRRVPGGTENYDFCQFRYAASGSII